MARAMTVGAAFVLAVLVVVASLAPATEAAHHHGRRPATAPSTMSAPHWHELDSGMPLMRHHLRHHGQDAPASAAGGSSLDQLIDRLDGINRLEPAGVDGYWKHRLDEKSRRAIEEYERGDVAEEAKQATSPLLVGARKTPLVDAKHRHRPADDDDEDDDDDSMTDEDDKDEEGDDDDEDVSDEDDAESKEVDKEAASREVDDMMAMDYDDNSQALSDSPPSLSYSEQKWKNFGSRESLAYTRRHGVGPESERAHLLAKQARDHLQMMSREGACKVPRPQLVKIKDVYPNPSKDYLPHCTILHKCNDFSGCCRSNEYTCQAKKTNKVSLPFYTTRVGHVDPIVEKFEFFNDTECECVRRTDQEVNQLGSYRGALSGALGGVSAVGAADAYPARKQRQTRTQLDMAPPYIQVPPYNKPGCRCPSNFSPREMGQSKGCACDCFDRQQDCLRYKKGKAYFSWEDRLCIQQNQCKLPECEFGSYMKLSGRCPKKNDHYYIHQRRP